MAVGRVAGWPWATWEEGGAACAAQTGAAETRELPGRFRKPALGTCCFSAARPSHPHLSLLLQFNDVLLYTSRGLTASNQFKVHGQLPLYGMTVSMRRGHEIGGPALRASGSSQAR